MARTDRMGALGTSGGRRFKLHAAAVHFGAHYGTKITPCLAGDAKRKGRSSAASGSCARASCPKSRPPASPQASTS